MSEVVNMHLVVKTQVGVAVREINKKKGYKIKNIDGSFLPELNEKVMNMLENAIERANANHRRTLMDKDI